MALPSALSRHHDKESLEAGLLNPDTRRSHSETNKRTLPLVAYMVFVISIFLILLLGCHVEAPGDPFRSQSSGQERTERQKERKITFLSLQFEKVMVVQQKLHSRLAKLFRKIKDEPSLGALLVLFILSSTYGAVQSLAPGHGKLFTFSHSCPKTLLEKTD
jgi:hypothetical protein